MSGRLCRCAHSKNAHVQVAHSAFFHFARLTAAAHNPKNGLRKIVWGSTRSRIFFGDFGLPSAALRLFKKCSCAVAHCAFSHFARLTATVQNSKDDLRKIISVVTFICCVVLTQKMIMCFNSKSPAGEIVQSNNHHAG
jgi:hypothetical protein